MPKILRRLGASPTTRCTSLSGCPDLFELDNGDFAVVGADATEELLPTLPPDAGVAPYERIVVIDRATLLAAKNDIPDETP